MAATAGLFPLPLDQYPPAIGATLAEVLVGRAQLSPFNLVGTAIFALAVGHTFFAQRFRRAAHHLQQRKDAQARGAGREPQPWFWAEILHFLGEVEVVFGLWVVVLLAAITSFFGWEVARSYLSGTVHFTEPLFVVVIMALASSRPVLFAAERALSVVAALGGGTPLSWWLTLLTVGPLLGSFITEPAAMTICALLLGRQFYERRPSPRLAYATLGLLFVNVSVGGTLTHFAAPPVLMVARPWGWDMAHMLSSFGAPAVAGILAANLTVLAVFRTELRGLAARAAGAAASERDVPFWVVAVTLFFVAFAVANAHDPPLFIGGFLFFLGFARATAPHQSALDLKPPLLVGFFLAGLVVHGGLQGWWIAPVLERLGTVPLFGGAALLTAFNDNALITYLATLVPGLGEPARHAVVAGAVAGGGLTVIANAPNPAGQSILDRHFEGGISPLRLLAGALGPTLIVAAAFLLAS